MHEEKDQSKFFDKFGLRNIRAFMVQNRGQTFLLGSFGAGISYGLLRLNRYYGNKSNWLSIPAVLFSVVPLLIRIGLQKNDARLKEEFPDFKEMEENGSPVIPISSREKKSDEDPENFFRDDEKEGIGKDGFLEISQFFLDDANDRGGIWVNEIHFDDKKYFDIFHSQVNFSNKELKSIDSLLISSDYNLYLADFDGIIITEYVLERIKKYDELKIGKIYEAVECSESLVNTIVGKTNDKYYLLTKKNEKYHSSSDNDSRSYLSNKIIFTYNQKFGCIECFFNFKLEADNFILIEISGVITNEANMNKICNEIFSYAKKKNSKQIRIKKLTLSEFSEDKIQKIIDLFKKFSAENVTITEDGYIITLK